MANDRPRIAPWPGYGAAPRADVLSDVYRYVLECRAKRQAGEPASEAESCNTAAESGRISKGALLKENAT